MRIYTYNQLYTAVSRACLVTFVLSENSITMESGLRLKLNFPPAPVTTESISAGIRAAPSPIFCVAGSACGREGC